MLANLRQKWHELSRREQLYVGVAGVALIIFLGYSFIVSPLINSVTSLQQQYVQQQNLLAWMTPRVAALANLNNVTLTQPVSANNLLATVDAQLKQTSFATAVNGISQANANQVRVTLKEVSFDELMSWLTQQWQQSQIQVTEFTAQRTDKLGMVSVTMTLTATS